MTPGQRRMHRIIWFVLGPALVLMLAIGVALRGPDLATIAPAPEPADANAAEVEP